MFEEAKPDPNPRGVRLGDLAKMLSATTIKPNLVDNGLLAEHGSYTVRVEVVPPEVAQTPDGEISAVVLISIDIH